MDIWYQRANRFRKRIGLKTEDFKRSLEWHVGGGYRYFVRYGGEIAKSHKWCFIVACNNSGTSLLHSMLAKTGKVSTMPFEGQIYTTSLTRATKRGYERVWTEYLNDLRLKENDSLDCAPRLIHDWMRELDLPIQELIIEKTTANAVRMTWLQKVFPNSYFIGVVRNGYAVTEGICRKGKKSAERGARHWNLVNKIMLEDSKKVNNYLEIRYEDLVVKPEDTVKKIAEFIGINYKDLTNALKQEYDFETIRGKHKLTITNLNNESIRRLKKEEIENIYTEAKEMLDFFDYKPIAN